MDYTEMFRARLTQLRLEKGVSARDMSLSLGQSESYINKIENSRAMPSMSGFFYICDYLGITPQDFFNTSLQAPGAVSRISAALSGLTAQEAEHILAVIEDITKKQKIKLKIPRRKIRRGIFAGSYSSPYIKRYPR